MATESLFTKLRKNTTIPKEILKNSRYFNNGENITPFSIPILNLALMGSLENSGYPPGITMIAAPPKHFKTSLMIQAMKAFQEKHKGKDNLIIFYDSEFGSPDAYFTNAGIDCSEEHFDRRPITTVEGWRSDIANLVEDIGFGDNVLICVDSIGMLASIKETEDAKAEKTAADMTRAKQIKSTFRIVNAQLNLKGIAMIVINHTYLSQDMYPTEVTAGGRGAQYACHTLWNIGKRQKKEGTELTGFDFMIRPVFSRYIREKSEFPITVTYDDGIEKYSGLFDLAFDLGIIKSEKQGWYIIDNSGKGFRRSDVEEDIVYMEALSKNKEFNKALEEKFKIN